MLFFTTKKDMTLSRKGLLFGWPLGVPKASASRLLRTFKCAFESKAASKFSRGREPFIQLPVSFNSSMVWMLTTKNFAEGPSGVFPRYMNRSVF